MTHNGRGHPAGTRTWETQFESGHWRFLETIEESARYGVVAAYITHLFDRPAVLDAGCGEGRLLDFLSRGWRRYVGVDISTAAVAHAAARTAAEIDVQVGDVELWEPDGEFDAIVFNECLYYVRDPGVVVGRYAHHLRDGGVFVVSMFRHANARQIWRTIEREVRCLDASELRNSKGEVTDIKVLSLCGRVSGR